MATTVGTIQLLATIDTSRYKQGAKEIEKSNNNIESSANTTEKKSNAAFNGIAKVGLAAVAAAAVAVGVAITKNIGNAVDRIDTLVAFPRVLEALGGTAEEAQNATNRLSEALKGLPTSLQAGASGVQGLVTAGLDVNKATEAFLGLNNALLFTGADAQDTQVVMDGLRRAISGGTTDVTSMEAILKRIPSVLQALSNETGKTQGELTKMFAENPQSLIDNIVRLNKEGGGGLDSLDDQARKATGGIGTAFENMNNAITRGIEGIVRSIGDGGTDQEKLVSGQEKISNAITSVGNAFGFALGQVGPFINFLIRNKNVFAPIAVGISAIVAALTAWWTITKLITIAQSIFNAVLAANPIGLIVVAIIGLVAAFVWLWNNVEGFRNFFVKAWEGIRNAVTGVFNWVKTNWPLLLAILTGPIGLAVLLIIRNFDKIRDVARNVFNWIKGVFSTIGDVASGIFRGAVNAVLGTAENIINGFIRAINNVVGIINRIPGVNIGNIGELNIPRLANGGVVTSPTLAEIGEGGEPEAVIPLSKLDQMLGNDNSNRGNGRNPVIEQTNNVYTELDMNIVNRRLTWELNRA